jgi:hypothetical protein
MLEIGFKTLVKDEFFAVWRRDPGVSLLILVYIGDWAKTLIRAEFFTVCSEEGAGLIDFWLSRSDWPV